MVWTAWKKGNPPGVGWYNASRERTGALLRHWDGAAWSAPEPEDGAGWTGDGPPRRDTRPTDGMEWRDYNRAFRRVLDASNRQGHGVR